MFINHDHFELFSFSVVLPLQISKVALLLFLRVTTSCVQGTGIGSRVCLAHVTIAVDTKY